MASSFKARAKRVLAGGLGAVAVAALAPLGLAQPAAAATAPICTSSSHPALAAKLSRDITSALRGRTDTYALSVYDRNTGVSCSLHPYYHFDSASIVKATILAALLYERHGLPTATEAAHVRPMIENSDNNAASWLWYHVGRTRIQRFLNAAGMTTTYLGPGGYWGLTQVDARDEMRLLNAYTDRTDLLTSKAKTYALHLMANVESDQRWGTPYGTPAGVTAHVKNGWLPRASLGWRVNSLGIFTGSGHDYRMAVLTDNQATMGYGITTIERVAYQVHRDLGRLPGHASATASPRAEAALPQPGADTPAVQRGDGSAPFGRVQG